MVAIAFSANLWRFLWGPLADLTLSLRKWFWIAIVSSSVGLLVLCITPITTKNALLLVAVQFVSQVAATLIMLPVGGFMAHRIADGKKGSAGGWFQAGNLAGTGVGGGAGLWLCTHYGILTAGIVLSTASLILGFSVLLIKDVPCNQQERISQRIRHMGRDLLEMIKIPIVLFVIMMICMPIGPGAVSNLWSAIAKDWHVGADMIALVTGILSSIVSAIGCLLGGFIADRYGNWVAYLSCGLACVLSTLVMSALPMQPYFFVGGVLAYSFTTGMVYAAFSSVVLFAIGRHNASTKYAMLSSLGNLPIVYMTSIDGWLHDRYNSKMMLATEAIIGLLFILVCIALLKWMGRRKLVLQIIE